MADAQKYAEWLIANEGKKGTPEFETVATAYKAARKPMTQIEPAGLGDPTSGMSGLQKFGAGAGKAFVDIGRGVGQLVGVNDQASIDESKSLDAPLMKTGAGLAGNIAGNVAAFAPTAMIPGANTITGAGLIGAGMGAIGPVASDESRASNIALGAAGGAAGQGIANAVGRAVRPVQSTLNPVQSELAAKAGQMGIPLTAGQKTGSRPLQITESVLENLPFTADAQLAQRAAQRGAFNKAASKTIGENADLITPEVLNAAKTRIGDTFNQLSARNTVGLNDDFVDAIVKISGDINGFSSPQIEKTLDKALDLASKKTISGREYQSIRSTLGRQANSAMSSDADLGRALKAVQSALDDAATGSISEADKAAWATARKQWQALKVIEKAAAPTTADAVAGNVSPAKLASALNTADKGFKYGKGQQELGDLARIGQAFVKDSVPNSGTAQRSLYQEIINNPTKIIPAAAGLGSVPLQGMLNSKMGQSYLLNGLLPKNEMTGLLGATASKGLALGVPASLYASQQ